MTLPWLLRWPRLKEFCVIALWVVSVATVCQIVTVIQAVSPCAIPAGEAGAEKCQRER